MKQKSLRRFRTPSKLEKFKDIVRKKPSLPEFLYGAKVVDELPFNLLGTKYKDHRRLTVFHNTGTKCVHPDCDVIGTKLLVTVSSNKSIHVDLFSDDYILLTVDHIIPKSKGGSEKLSNKQCLCEYHNRKKSDKLVAY